MTVALSVRAFDHTSRVINFPYSYWKSTQEVFIFVFPPGIVQASVCVGESDQQGWHQVKLRSSQICFSVSQSSPHPRTMILFGPPVDREGQSSSLLCFIFINVGFINVGFLCDRHQAAWRPTQLAYLSPEDRINHENWYFWISIRQPWR